MTKHIANRYRTIQDIRKVLDPCGVARWILGGSYLAAVTAMRLKVTMLSRTVPIAGRNVLATGRSRDS